MINSLFSQNDNAQELMRRFIEGELTDEEERNAFFSLMAANPSLQTELHSMMLIRSMLRADIPAMPDIAAEDQLIARVMRPPAIQPVESPLYQLKNWQAGAIGAIIATLFYAALFVLPDTDYSFFAQHIEPQHYSIYLPALKAGIQVAHSAPGSTTALLNTPADKQGSVPAKSSIRNQYNSLQQKQKDKNSLDQNTSNSLSGFAMQNQGTRTKEFNQDIPHNGLINPNMELIQDRTNAAIHSIQNVYRQAAYPVNIKHSSVYSFEQFNDADQKMNLRAELRGFWMSSFPSPDIPGLISPPINNFAIALLHSAGSEDLCAGLELGQETILQVYSIQNGGENLKVEQNYLAWYIAGVLHYAPASLEYNGFKSFLRASAGATRMGPLGKIILGVEYSPYKTLGLFTGAESAGFFAWQDASTIFTAKVGFTAGISINF
jgi:hypothetical protein